MLNENLGGWSLPIYLPTDLSTYHAFSNLKWSLPIYLPINLSTYHALQTLKWSLPIYLPIALSTYHAFSNLKWSLPIYLPIALSTYHAFSNLKWSLPIYLPIKLCTYHALQTLKWSFTYIPTYWLIYLPCFCKRYNGAYLSIYLPTYLPTYIPTDLCTYHASQTLKWSANDMMQICCGNLFRRISESKIEERGRKTDEEDGDYCSFLLCCFFFGPSSMKSLSRFISLVVVAFFFYNWSSCSRLNFCSLIFKHRDGEFCFSVLVL
jgi:hypothetical protein